MDAFLECTKQVDIFLSNDDDLHQYLQAIAAQVVAVKEKRRIRRPSKAQIDKLDLELPMTHYTVWDVSHMQHTVAEKEDGSPTEDLSAIPECKFWGKMFELHNVAKLAAGFLYSDIRILMNERGNLDIKRDILNWMFADVLEFEDGTKLDSKPMWKIPFTCQFCCWVEEIDYEQLCDTFAYLLEKIQSMQEEATRASLANEPQTDLFWFSETSQTTVGASASTH